MRGTIIFDLEAQPSTVKIDRVSFTTTEQMESQELIRTICPAFIYLPVQEIIWHQDQETKTENNN